MTPSCPHPGPRRRLSKQGGCRPAPGRLASPCGQSRPRRAPPEGRLAVGRAWATSGRPGGPPRPQLDTARLPLGGRSRRSCSGVGPAEPCTAHPQPTLLPLEVLGAPTAEEGAGRDVPPRRSPDILSWTPIAPLLVGTVISPAHLQVGKLRPGRRHTAGPPGPKSPREGVPGAQTHASVTQTLPGLGAGLPGSWSPWGPGAEGAGPLAISGVRLGHLPQAGCRDCRASSEGRAGSPVTMCPGRFQGAASGSAARHPFLLQAGWPHPLTRRQVPCPGWKPSGWSWNGVGTVGCPALGW